MLGHDIPDNDGFALAEALGRDAFFTLGAGLDGKAFALEDGDTLKVALRSREAAIAQQVMIGAIDPDQTVFPAIKDVRATELADGTPAWAIVREAIEEVFQDPSPEEKTWIDAWRVCADAAIHGVTFGDRARLKQALDFWGDRSPNLAAFAEALAEAAKSRSFQIGDLGWNNLGVTRSGELRIRDHSGFSLRDDLHVTAMRAIEPLAKNDPAPR